MTELSKRSQTNSTNADGQYCKSYLSDRGDRTSKPLPLFTYMACATRPATPLRVSSQAMSAGGAKTEWAELIGIFGAMASLADLGCDMGRTSRICPV